jgi:hypothetical protein
MVMNSPCLNCEVRDECQPYGSEHFVDGAFIKEMRIPYSGTIVPQHSHAYDHISYVAKGKVLFEGKMVKAPTALMIPAGKKHMFQSLEDDCLILCIHNVSRTGSIEVLEENQPFADKSSCLPGSN